MKKLLVGALAIGSAFSSSAVLAGQSDDARLEALEKENATIRKEITLLRENKSLRQQSAAIRSSQPPQTAPLQTAPPPQQTFTPVSLVEPKVADPFGAYAADLPVAYKAAPLEQKGVFRVWGEGGAMWSGGDPVSSPFQLGAFNGAGLLFGNLFSGGPAGVFDLTPKVGWEAAAGFDYRFANSLWHVSGQFRYGEGGKTSGSASNAGVVSPALLALILGGPLPAGFAIGGNENLATSYKETHWLADIAVGRDVLGTGPEAMQVKAGLRLSEFVSKANTTDNIFAFVNVPPVFALNLATNTVTQTRNSFLGAGPRVGIEGSVPFAGHWAFDYLGDAAILFGTQTMVTNSVTNAVVAPPLFGILAGLFNNSNSNTTRQYASVFNADMQVGVSYWMTQNVKLSASYRLDAYINVSNDVAIANTTNRYVHGPHLGVTAQF